MFKLGRLPRKFDKRIPRLRSIFGENLPTPPDKINYAANLPSNIGVMLNDNLGDCTCAAPYHAFQLWTADAQGNMITPPDSCVLKMYKEACGYNPGDANSDQGGIEQDVLAYMLNTGMPMTDGTYEKILMYVEVDHKNLDHLKLIIAECGVAYVGFDLPQSVMDNASDNTVPWGVAGDNTSAGGHAVILVGYDANYFYLISWGQMYCATYDFITERMDEAYGISSKRWIESTGKTPFNLTEDQTTALMSELKE